MAYAIFRIKKITSMQNIKAVQNHNNRETKTKNADPQKTNMNQQLIPQAPDLVKAWKEKTKNVTKTIRKDAVVATEILLSASPEWFRPDNPERPGEWDQHKVECWVKVQKQFIKENFPDAISAVLHLDESTPHIHVLTVPLTNGGTALSNKDLFGGAATLSKWQDKYAKANIILGLQRGIKGSKARHVDIKDFYGVINSPTPQIKTLPERTIAEQIPWTAKGSRRRSEEHKQTRRLNRALKKAKIVPLLQRQNKTLKARAASAEQRLTQIKADPAYKAYKAHDLAQRGDNLSLNTMNKTIESQQKEIKETKNLLDFFEAVAHHNLPPAYLAKCAKQFSDSGELPKPWDQMSEQEKAQYLRGQDAKKRSFGK